MWLLIQLNLGCLCADLSVALMPVVDVLPLAWLFRESVCGYYRWGNGSFTLPWPSGRHRTILAGGESSVNLLTAFLITLRLYMNIIAEVVCSHAFFMSFIYILASVHHFQIIYLPGFHDARIAICSDTTRKRNTASRPHCTGGFSPQPAVCEDTRLIAMSPRSSRVSVSKFIP